jgi:hypothetical protein
MVGSTETLCPPYNDTSSRISKSTAIERGPRRFDEARRVVARSEVGMHQAEGGSDLGDLLEVREVVGHKRQVVDKAARRYP